MLDLHFSPTEPDLFAVATSTGAICLFVVEHRDTELIHHVKTIKLADTSILVLALAWTPPEVDAPVLAASLSNGRIVMFDYKARQSSMRTFTSHSLEAWTVAWSTRASGPEFLQLYSGGDDSAICRHNLKSDQLSVGGSTDTEEADSRPVSLDTQIHMAGVTAIAPLFAFDEGKTEFLLTGSYDEYVRVLAIDTSPNSTKFQVLAEKRLHGGVWKLMNKEISMVDPRDEVTFTVVASCMHAGAQILRTRRSKKGEWTIEVAARFEEHGSMNYAIDAQFDSDGQSPTFIVVSTSFYDRKLCVWNFRVHENL